MDFLKQNLPSMTQLSLNIESRIINFHLSTFHLSAGEKLTGSYRSENHADMYTFCGETPVVNPKGRACRQKE